MSPDGDRGDSLTPCWRVFLKALEIFDLPPTKLVMWQRLWPCHTCKHANMQSPVSEYGQKLNRVASLPVWADKLANGPVAAWLEWSFVAGLAKNSASALPCTAAAFQIVRLLIG